MANFLHNNFDTYLTYLHNYLSALLGAGENYENTMTAFKRYAPY